MIRKLYQQMNTMIDLKLEIIKILKTSINAIKFQQFHGGNKIMNYDYRIG